MTSIILLGVTVNTYKKDFDRLLSAMRRAGYTCTKGKTNSTAEANWFTTPVSADRLEFSILFVRDKARALGVDGVSTWTDEG